MIYILPTTNSKKVNIKKKVSRNEHKETTKKISERELEFGSVQNNTRISP